MVDGKSPGSVIPFDPRPEPARLPQDGEETVPETPRTGEALWEPAFLLERLESGSDQVRMWAAYQLIERWRDDAPDFVDALWRSPLVEVRESAINLIGRHGLQSYAFPLLRLFTADTDGLRGAAGPALGRLGYEPAERVLVQWFDHLLASREGGSPEFEQAAESLLRFDRERFWPHLAARLHEHRQNHAVFITLFRLLCRNAETPEEYELLGRCYGGPRELFHDFHLAQVLLELAGRPNVSRYLQSRLNGGYPLAAVYQECLRLLGADPHGPRTRQLLDAMEGCRNHQGGVARFIPIAAALMDCIVPGTLTAARLQGFLQGWLSWVERWEEAILKVREVEYHLLVSLPLVALLEETEAACLADPEGEALRITRIYRSPLLSPGFMRQILTLIANRDYPVERVREEQPAMGGWLWDEEKDALWKLFTDQLDDVDYPFEQMLPRPWSYQIPGLMPRLARLLGSRVEHYLDAGRRQAVDYALEVFRHEAGEAVIGVVLRRFDDLINHHFTPFVDLITHVPDPRFLRPLLGYHRQGEEDLARLIRFVCDVHERPCPAALRQAERPRSGGGSPATVRLFCPGCRTAYQYAYDALYVNEECIEQRQVPLARDLWIPAPIRCKNCGRPVPLEPDEGFLNDLYAELMAARLLHHAGEGYAPLGRVRLIHFPVWEGRVTNPEAFLAQADRLLVETETDTARQAEALYELGRFYLEIGEPDEARRVFGRILAGPARSPRALYYMGVIAFQERDLYQARVYFSRLVGSCSREEFERELDNPVDMAHHYLKLLDKREFKRSHFQLISS